MSDYIERELLIKTLPRAQADIFENCRNCTCLDSEQIETIIKSVPAADVRPVVRGKWLDLWIEDDEIIAGGYTVPQCSECKEDNYGTTPFCPFCGADMRGSADV